MTELPVPELPHTQIAERARHLFGAAPRHRLRSSPTLASRAVVSTIKEYVRLAPRHLRHVHGMLDDGRRDKWAR